VKLFPWQKKPEFFTPEQRQQLVEAIQKAEQRTSGEVRLFVETRCRYVEAMDRATQLFLELGMQNTKDRNATLIYVAVKDKQAAILGDQGIHEKVGQKYWQDEVEKMMLYFRQQDLAAGLCECIRDIGEALHFYFPYERDTDKNELPDEIVFGR
jgi:uncharacterized membrane protein